MNASVAAKSDVGRVREGNEDSYLVRDPLFVVADGMGGHLAGDVASQTAVQLITDKTQETTLEPGALAGLIREANAAIYKKASSDPSLHGMGTTCTLLFLGSDVAHLAHVGDSRAYLYRNDELRQVTEDHTLVQRMVKEGRIRKDEANRHPQRSIITRALGVDADVRVDTMEIAVEAGDRFLLCSDGLTSMIEDEDIAEVLARSDDPQTTVDRLVELANEAGGEDNVTVVLVEISEVGGSGSGGSGSGGSGAAEPAGSVAPSSVTSASSSAPSSEPSVRSSSADTGYFSSADVAEGSAAVEQEWDVVPERLRPRWGRIGIAAVLVLAIIAAAAYIGVRYLWLERSFFVGTNETGMVTIYRGVPEDVGGIPLHWEEQVTELEVAAVPEFLREDLTAGITAGSLSEAEARVADLEERAQDAEFEREQEAQDELEERRQQKDGDGKGGGG